MKREVISIFTSTSNTTQLDNNNAGGNAICLNSAEWWGWVLPASWCEVGWSSQQSTTARKKAFCKSTKLKPKGGNFRLLLLLRVESEGLRREGRQCPSAEKVPTTQREKVPTLQNAIAKNHGITEYGIRHIPGTYHTYTITICNTYINTYILRARVFIISIGVSIFPIFYIFAWLFFF